MQEKFLSPDCDGCHIYPAVPGYLQAACRFIHGASGRINVIHQQNAGFRWQYPFYRKSALQILFFAGYHSAFSAVLSGAPGTRYAYPPGSAAHPICLLRSTPPDYNRVSFSRRMQWNRNDLRDTALADPWSQPVRHSLAIHSRIFSPVAIFHTVQRQFYRSTIGQQRPTTDKSMLSSAAVPAVFCLRCFQWLPHFMQ